MQKTAQNLRYAFTMVEVIICVMILGILAAIVIPQFQDVTKDARERAQKVVRLSPSSSRGDTRYFNLEKGDLLMLALRPDVKSRSIDIQPNIYVVFVSPPEKPDGVAKLGLARSLHPAAKKIHWLSEMEKIRLEESFLFDVVISNHLATTKTPESSLYMEWAKSLENDDVGKKGDQ